MTKAQPATTYIQTESDIKELEASGYCENCLVRLSEIYEANRFGHYEIYIEEDSAGNLVGFLCPACAADAPQLKEGAVEQIRQYGTLGEVLFADGSSCWIEHRGAAMLARVLADWADGLPAIRYATDGQNVMLAFEPA